MTAGAVGCSAWLGAFVAIAMFVLGVSFGIWWTNWAIKKALEKKLPDRTQQNFWFDLSCEEFRRGQKAYEEGDMEEFKQCVQRRKLLHARFMRARDERSA